MMCKFNFFKFCAVVFVLHQCSARFIPHEDDHDLFDYYDQIPLPNQAEANGYQNPDRGDIPFIEEQVQWRGDIWAEREMEDYWDNEFAEIDKRRIEEEKRNKIKISHENIIKDLSVKVFTTETPSTEKLTNQSVPIEGEKIFYESYVTPVQTLTSESEKRIEVTRSPKKGKKKGNKNKNKNKNKSRKGKKKTTQALENSSQKSNQTIEGKEVFYESYVTSSVDQLQAPKSTEQFEVTKAPKKPKNGRKNHKKNKPKKVDKEVQTDNFQTAHPSEPTTTQALKKVDEPKVELVSSTTKKLSTIVDKPQTTLPSVEPSSVQTNVEESQTTQVYKNDNSEEKRQTPNSARIIDKVTEKIEQTTLYEEQFETTTEAELFDETTLNQEDLETTTQVY